LSARAPRATLVRREPSAFTLGARPDRKLATPPEVAVSLPSELLERRPHVAAAVTTTQRAPDQANLRYCGGIVTYLEVVSTENAARAATGSYFK
jgi:outer membrane protein TolC